MKGLANVNIVWASVVLITVYGSFTALLWYIWNKKDKQDEERFKSHENVMKTMADNQRDLTILVTKLELTQEYHEKDIEAIKAKM